MVHDAVAPNGDSHVILVFLVGLEFTCDLGVVDFCVVVHGDIFILDDIEVDGVLY